MDATEADIKCIFGHALTLSSPEERAAYLQKVCAGNRALRAEIESLLRAYQEAGSFLGERAPAPTVPVEDSICERSGTVIGPYKLMEQIGEGGMGLVFVAEQQEPIRRRVALKIIKPGMDSRQVIARFEAERQALALMDHPNIAKVHDGGATPDGRPYFVMEWVKGTPITEYCDTHCLSIRQRLQLFLDVCHAVQHAHQKGIIHRDLKPSNILVEIHDVHPVVKIIDFGIAKATGQKLTEKTVYTSVAQLVGTPLYMSPEQAGLSSLDVDTRSDLYSLGVLLYELLTGATPFKSETLKQADYDEMRRIIREEEPPRPSTRVNTMEQAALSTIAEKRGLEPRRLNQQLRGDLDWIVMKALEKDRNRRYESAGAFAADVQRYLNDEPVLACPPTKLYRVGKFVRRHKAGLGVATVLLLAMLLGASSWLWLLQKRAGAEGEARVAIQEAREHLESERWSEALSAARRAEGVLAGVGGDATLRQQIKILIEDLEMARKLQEARLRITAVKNGRFDIEAGARAYADAFREYGFNIDGLDPHMVGEQIRARAIHRQLVAALDYWALILKTLNAEGWSHRLAVARAADEDPSRNRLRDWLEGKDPKAVEELTAAGGEEELPAQTLDLLGNLAFRTSSAERVVALLERAQQRHPDDFWINQLLVALHNRSQPRRLEKEIRFASVAVALRPLSPGARYNLGVALQNNGQLNEAIPEYREAIRLKEDYAEAHVQLGDALAGKGRLDEAIAEYRAAVRIKKDFPEAHDNLGRALLDQGRLEEAIPELREALKSDFPGAYKAHNGLGMALGLKGQLNEAIDEFRAAIQLNKDCVEAHFNLAIALGMKDRLDEAIDAYCAAIRIKKDYAHAHLNLGNALKGKGLLDDAITEYREALKSNFPGAYMVHGNLGDAFQEKGQLDKALAEYREGIRLKKDDAQLYNHLARLLATCPDLKLRDAGQAVATAKKAVDLASGDGGCWNTLGIAQYRNGDWKAALAALNKSVQLRKGGDSSDFFFLAMAHWQLNEKDKARAWYEQAVAWMDKHNPKSKELKRFREEATALLGLAKAADVQNKKK